MKSYLFGLFTLPILINALIEEDVMPKMLQDCYSSQTDISTNTIQNNCLEGYLSHLYRNNSFSVALDKSALNWIDSLGSKLHLRLKRQARRRGGRRNGKRLRVRKEIRTLSENERKDLFLAINQLKRDTSEKPNKYDALALLHQGMSLDAAHDGPAFVGWHRYYLVLYEEALRTKQRRVTLAYWDSTLDFRMTDPAETILFSELFLGNGQGPVFTGPFALWRTPSSNTYLWRDIPGPQSSLINPTTLQNVFNKKYHREILSPTAARDEDNLERHHDGVHRWVGGRDGHMGGLETSPQDPVFWFHHCYIDYLWEKFREGQKSKGVDSEKDYPETTIESQKPNKIMSRLTPPKTNLYGFSNDFTRTIYRYSDAPSCSNKCGGARQSYLRCDRSQNGCVSRSRTEYIRDGDYRRNKYNIWNRNRGNAEPIVSLAPADAPSDLVLSDQQRPQLLTNPKPAIQKRFKQSLVDARTQARRKRSINGMVNQNNIRLGLDIAISMPNEHHWNGNPAVLNPENWAAAPIEIINTHNMKNAFDLQNLQAKITDPLRQNGITRLQIENRYIRNTFNITLQTDGFSYNGRHVENVILDKRSHLSETIAFIVFKKPLEEETKAYVRVYDSFGGECQSYCLATEYRYQECTGVIKVTPDYPTMYFDYSSFDLKTKMKPFFRFICEN